jgi:hypothetical protein
MNNFIPNTFSRSRPMNNFKKIKFS